MDSDEANDSSGKKAMLKHRRRADWSVQPS
jgi:hypothetical protein